MENTNKERSRCLSLAHMCSRQLIKPFYGDLDRYVTNGTLRQQDFINDLKSGIFSIKSMGDVTWFARLSKTSIELLDYYHNDDIKLAKIDVRQNRKHESWIISNTDFSPEYKAFIVMKEKDENFYSSIRRNAALCRRAHNALMDILDRDFSPNDQIVLKALETLQIQPVYHDENDLYQTIIALRDTMKKYCDKNNISINAMNTMSPSEIIDVRNCGRAMLREKHMDSLILKQAEKLRNTKELDNQEIGGSDYERT